MSVDAYGQTAADPAVFADRILGTPLWDYQAEVAHSPARYRIICAGRQVGKSFLIARIILHEAATRANIVVLIVSAGEESSKRLLAECAAAARGALGGSVLDDNTMTLTLSNGSRIIAVPASIKQIRGWPVDVLVIDEAGFVGQDIWDAAEPAIIARPGARVLLVSSPWGGAEHYFRRMWQEGMGTALDDPHIHSWHWPCTMSPLIDLLELERIRGRKSVDVFAREYMAEWTDESGSYFSEKELTEAVAQYELLSPADALEAGGWWEDGPGMRPALPAIGGIDWGMARDANAVVLLSPLEDCGLNRDLTGGRLVFFVPWMEARYQCPWDTFIGSLVDLCTHGYAMEALVSEVNGVGAYPSDDLKSRVFSEHRWGTPSTIVSKVWTDARRKQSGFGMIKSLLQRHQLVLPNHPELLSQLRGLEFEQLAGGSMRIAVPDAVGHDDLAMALLQAVSALRPDAFRPPVEPLRGVSKRTVQGADVVVTASGVQVPLPARPMVGAGWWYRSAKGREKGEAW
jgi:hypothetical protein